MKRTGGVRCHAHEKHQKAALRWTASDAAESALVAAAIWGNVALDSARMLSPLLCTQPGTWLQPRPQAAQRIAEAPFSFQPLSKIREHQHKVNDR